MLISSKYKRILLVFTPLVVLYLLSLYANSLGLFDRCVWLSPLFHFSGGFLVALVLFSCYQIFDDLKIAPGFLLFISVVSITLLVGVFWEFYEFVSDQILQTNHQTTIEDTLSDLFMDIVGALVFCIVYFAKSRLKLTGNSK